MPVPVGVLGLDRGEGAGADMQRDEAALRCRRHPAGPAAPRSDAARPSAPRRRRRGGRTRSDSRAGPAGRRRARGGCRVAAAWHPASRMAASSASPASAKSRRTLPSVVLAGDLGHEPGCQLDRIARPQPLAGPRQRPPAGVVDPLDQRHLDRHLAATAEEAGRQHAGVVEHQRGRPAAAGRAGRAPRLAPAARHRPAAAGRRRAAAPAPARSAPAAARNRTGRRAWDSGVGRQRAGRGRIVAGATRVKGTAGMGLAVLGQLPSDCSHGRDGPFLLRRGLGRRSSCITGRSFRD